MTAALDPTKAVRILGVDTALRTTGYGVIDAHGSRLSPVDAGVIKTTRKYPFSECLRRLAGGIRELVKLHAPDVVAIEGAFYCRNVRTSMVLGSARGAVIATVAELAIPMYEYAPRRVKQAVCGHGNASKEQVALLVSQILGISVANLGDDSTDALALCICQAHTAQAKGGLSLPDPL
ncbi:MAG: crossover junction endodeoxyribonuclease RuvC [Victivallales bacterium]|nr:crossover junction endodeoxyribonuclease RuvC [Victivallales bacterium]MBT7164914.1 crossover junction endodeoxyribonuclease RuvC [Victivallales bacterium]MBT7300037.1 crossover junction endodeoxyribonuclease RuvC [Victivallales bacterium]